MLLNILVLSRNKGMLECSLNISSVLNEVSFSGNGLIAKCSSA